MKKPRKGKKGIIIIVIGVVALVSILGAYTLLSEGSPFATKYVLTVTVKDDQGFVQGATVTVNDDTYTTDSTGSITPLTLDKDTYVIVVNALEHGTKTQTIDLASDMDLIIEIDYSHQYLSITSPTDGGLIDQNSAEHDPVTGMADIVIWVKGTYASGRVNCNYIKTFIDDGSLYALTPISPTWNARAYIGRISEGRHTLYVQCLSSGSVIEQQTITINVPSEWHVSFSTVGLADTGEGISRHEYGYWLGMNPPFPGVMTRIFGEFYLDTLGNEPWEVWLDLYDPTINGWRDAVDVFKNTRQGWNSFDTGIDYITTDWFGFAGASYQDGTPYNEVTEFRGEIWMEAGTHYYHTTSINVIDWFNDQFFPAGEKKSTLGPAPVISDDGITILDADPSDLYAYEGSTAIAWVLCIAVSLVLFIGVVVFFRRRG